jgi:hypothetical protein
MKAPKHEHDHRRTTKYEYQSASFYEIFLQKLYFLFLSSPVNINFN